MWPQCLVSQCLNALSQINGRTPYHRIPEFLEKEEAAKILSQLLEKEHQFCHMKGDRNFLRLPNPLDALKNFEQKIAAVLPEVQERFHISLVQPEIELYVHAFNDGTHFDRHSDAYGGGNWKRRISCIYYVHREPRGFEGGELIVYGRSGRPSKVDPRHNSAVFFPSHLIHEVSPVKCRSKAFEDSRFGINVWIM